MTTEDAKTYLSHREIPQLFESLMTGLMFYRPEDHIQYLQECLKKIRDQGVDKVRWNLFIESRKKTPLPPITPDGTRRDKSFITELPKSLEEKRGSPLPPIRQGVSAVGNISLPDGPIILAMGGPGSGKATQCKKLVERYTGYVHLSMGDLLRQHILDEGTTTDKWGAISKIVSDGELAPDEMTGDLVCKFISEHMNAKGLIIEGYPRTSAQMEEFKKLIGRVDVAFVLDCEEQYLKERLTERGKVTGRVDDNQNAINQRIKFFKEETLQVIKEIDEMGKLAVLDGDRDVDEIFYELATMVDQVLGPATAPSEPTVPRPPTSPRPSSARLRSRPGSGFARVPTLLDMKVADTGRKPGLPQCPIVLLLSGPGCNKKRIARTIAIEGNGIVNLCVGDLLRSKVLEKSGESRWDKVRTMINRGEMADLDSVAEVVMAAMANEQSPAAIIIDGFPRNKEQVENFYKNIGNVTAAILLDCEEKQMREQMDNMIDKREDSAPDAISARISSYKHNTLPVLGHFDDKGKLYVVDAEKGFDSSLQEVRAIFQKLGLLQKSGRSEIRPPSVHMEVIDTGRRSGLPRCPLYAVVSAPGVNTDSVAQKVASELSLSCMNMAGKTISDLKAAMTNIKSKGLLIQNFPVLKQHSSEFNREIGGLEAVIVLDYPEDEVSKNATADEMMNYKNNTLPLLGYYDDMNRLAVVATGGKSEEQLAEDITAAVKEANMKPRIAGAATLPGAHSLVHVADTGRKEGLPRYPIISVVGSSGSGADEIAQKLAQEITGTVIIDAQELEASAIAEKLSADAKTVLLKGYPQNVVQIEDFNKTIGGMTCVVVIDATSEHCLKHGAEADQINHFKSNVIPALYHYDDFRKLEVIPVSEKEVEVFNQTKQAIESALNQGSG